jgi:hypothetical protein
MVKTYKNRTEEQQIEFNRQYKERKQKLAPDAIIPDNPEDDVVEVDVTNIAPAPAKSFFDKAKNIFAPDKEKKEKPQDKKAAEKNIKFMSQVLPATLASLVAINAEKLFQDPYKPCAPTKEEVETILLPLFNSISRHVELSTQVSQDALDFTTMIFATITVGTRVLITKMEIDRYVEQIRKENVHDFDSRIRRASPGTDERVARNPASEVSRQSGADDLNGSRNGTDGHSDDGASEAERVARLMRKDREGRAYLGLAPRVREDG